MKHLFLAAQNQDHEVSSGADEELRQLISLSHLHAVNGNWGQAIGALAHADLQREQLNSRWRSVGIESTRALLSAFVGDTLRAQSSLALCSELHTTSVNNHQCASVKALLARGMLGVDQCKVGDVSSMFDCLDTACHSSQHWAFAIHVIAQGALLQGEVDNALHLLEDLTVTRSLNVRSDTVLGGLLMRDYCEALMIAGEGNRLLQCAEAYSKPPAAYLPFAHFWLRLDEPLKSLRYSLLVLNGSLGTRRDRYEARLLQAAAEIHLGNEPSARQHFQACESVVAADFPALYRKFSAEVNRSFEKLGTYVHPANQCSLRLAALLGEAHRHPNIRVTADPEEPFRFVRLTEREREILGQLSQGATAQDIAERNVVSVHTVRTQLKAVYRKLYVNSASAAVMQAEHLGLIFETMFE